MIQRLSKAMSAALVGYNLSKNPSKFHFTSKQVSCYGPKFTKHQNLFDTRTDRVELSQYGKSDSTLSSSEPVAASSDCSRLGYAMCLCSHVPPAQAVLEHGSKSSAIDFAVKPFDFLLA